MAKAKEPSFIFNRFSDHAALFSVVIGFLVLVGWIFQIRLLASLNPNWVAMKFHTALAFMFSGLSLYFVSTNDKLGHRTTSLIFAGMAALIGFAVLLEYALNLGAFWDQFFVKDIWAADDLHYPGRMSPWTAFHFVLLGICLTLLNFEGKTIVLIGQGLISVVALTSTLNVIGYLYGVKILFASQIYTTVAFHTAVTFILLSLGILCRKPFEGVVAIFLGSGDGSRAARRLMPVVVIAPILLGALIVRGQNAAWSDPDFGLALLVSFNFLLLIPLIGWQAFLLNRESFELDKKDRLLSSVMHNMSEGVLVADRSGQTIYANPSAEKITGIRVLDEPQNEIHYDVFREDKVTPWSAEEMPLVQAVRGQEMDGVVQFLNPPSHKQGLFISVNGRALRDEKGAVTGGLVVLRDINDQLKKEERMKAYTRRLEESNRDMEDFIFVASHDLQEPLRKIQAFGGFLKKDYADALDEKGKSYIDRMRDSAGRMQVLIEDLLSLARVTTKAKPFVPCELSVIVNEVLSDLEARIHSSGARIEVGSLPVVEADPIQMRQLFQNLIGNSLKYHRLGVPPIIQVREIREGERRDKNDAVWSIQVEDNGIGFESKYEKQIFKAFERLHTREEYEGTGIGLAICRKVVERHGGSIQAEGFPNLGCKFMITLPIHQTFRGVIREEEN